MSLIWGSDETACHAGMVATAAATSAPLSAAMVLLLLLLLLSAVVGGSIDEEGRTVELSVTSLLVLLLLKHCDKSNADGKSCFRRLLDQLLPATGIWLGAFASAVCK
jgi:hypothetical protein